MFSLGEARRKSGLSAFQIRWYESAGLIGKVARTTGGQRRYTADQIARLAQIERWRSQDLGVVEIRALLDLYDGIDRDELSAHLLKRLRKMQQEIDGITTLATAIAQRHASDRKARPDAA